MNVTERTKRKPAAEAQSHGEETLSEFPLFSRLCVSVPLWQNFSVCSPGAVEFVEDL